jgi:hypothetical protein
MALKNVTLPILALQGTVAPGQILKDLLAVIYLVIRHVRLILLNVSVRLLGMVLLKGLKYVMMEIPWMAITVRRQALKLLAPVVMVKYRAMKPATGIATLVRLVGMQVDIRVLLSVMVLRLHVLLLNH